EGPHLSHRFGSDTVATVRATRESSLPCRHGARKPYSVPSQTRPMSRSLEAQRRRWAEALPSRSVAFPDCRPPVRSVVRFRARVDNPYVPNATANVTGAIAPGDRMDATATA